MTFSTDSSKRGKHIIRTRAELEAYLAKARAEQERKFKRANPDKIFRKEGCLTKYAVEWISGKYTPAGKLDLVTHYISLKNADLRTIAAENNGEGLVGLDLSGCNLKDKNLTGLNLTRTNLNACWLTKVKLAGANCTEADLRDGWMDFADCRETIFYNARLNRMHGAATTFVNADFREADISRSDFCNDYWDSRYEPQTILYGADFRGAKLKGAKFRKVDLSGVRIYDVDLIGVNIRSAKNLPSLEKKVVTTGTLECNPPPVRLVDSLPNFISINSSTIDSSHGTKYHI